MIKSKFKNNLKYLLKENKMTVRQLCDIIDINPRKIFTDKKIRLDKIEKIATLFMTNSYDLCFGNIKKAPKILRDVPSEIKSDKQSMESIMQALKIVSNYQKMNMAFMESIEFEQNPFPLQ